MSYRGPNTPDYCLLILTVKDILEGTLERLAEDERLGADPCYSFLDAMDQLEQDLGAIKRDLGV